MRLQDILDAAYKAEFAERQEAQIKELLQEALWLDEIQIQYDQLPESPPLEMQDPTSWMMRLK
jgi:hypothetical protein